MFFKNCSSPKRPLRGPLHWKNFQKTLIFALFLEFRTLCEHWLRLGADEVLLLTLCAKMNNLCKINCPENTTETAINFKFSLLVHDKMHLNQ